MKFGKRNKFDNKKDNKNTSLPTSNGTSKNFNEEKLKKLKNNEIIDRVYGFNYNEDGSSRIGWLMNMKASDMVDEEDRVVSAMDYFFLEEDGGRFKATIKYQPYFFVATKKDCESEVCTYMKKKYGDIISAMEIIEKEDLDLVNHLSGLRRTYVKISFLSSDDLMKVRRELEPKVTANKKREDENTIYGSLMAQHLGQSYTNESTNDRRHESVDKIVDMREYDVSYLQRTSIDLGLFAGSWYEVRGSIYNTSIIARKDLVDRPEPVVLAYDIETTKLPLKFPDAASDQVMMISYMVDGQGYLICNRDLIAADIDDFEFTPRPEFPGPFIVYNESDERQTLLRFLEHIRELRPNIIVTYNGDSFDWPFVETRANLHGLDLNAMLGFEQDSQGEYKARCVLHMDCYKWVQRDSYLPVGSQGLKAVCKAKLRYDPVEVDPEEMCTLAREEPRTLANYSVSDAVATYYLYMQYVHPFIFALGTIIPLEPDEVLRKGSGTLCEAILMVQAHAANVIFPNKQQQKYNELTAQGNLLESETYVGGHVEAIESGVFRSDIATKFRLVPEMCQTLRDNLAHTLKHVLTVEEKVDMASVTNFDEVVASVGEQLQSLQQVPNRMECPVIYHLDVAAMYPNIILSNRLQPSALVTEKTCAGCDHNGPSAKCKRPMEWMWRGEVMPASKSEFFLIQGNTEKMRFPPKREGEPMRAFHNLSKEEQATVQMDELRTYCRKAYKRSHNTVIEERTSVICQKENSFYVDTVRSFRDRRYEFKDLTKAWKRTHDGLVAKRGDPTEIKRASGMFVLYDSLQLAHKCILNSFYGYVMRRGARWYSMEMAGIVCNTGASIIKHAREIIEQIGRPLELDTDGIWCILPSSFPENITFKTDNPKKPTVTVSYPGAMLNVMVQSLFTNHQYHDLVDPVTRNYKVHSENSIFFEVDGPYKAMILPASKEQGKKLKKRYAVFNLDNSLAELKGFEVKRNGELNLIKIFQSSVFEAFLKGTTLEEVYQSVATVADRWLDLLHSHGANTSDEELLELISEKRCMSKTLAEYGKQKSTCISTAKRLAEFLGDEMVKGAGLSFRFIISKKPEGLQVTERAIPLAIFRAEPSKRRHYLRKWLKIPDLEEIDLRDILDWHYYIERFNSNIQKIITIPAALQHVSNPVPRVPHPEWLHKKVMEKEDTFKQRKIDDMFAAVPRPLQTLPDMENMVAFKRPRARIEQEKPEEEYSHWKEQLTEEKPCRLDTKLWLDFHKRKWAIQKLIKNRNVAKRRRMSTAGGGISSYLSRTKRSLLDDTWQIVQVVETAAPGIYKLWALIGQDLHCMRLSVPRTFYVNTRVAKEEGDNLFYKKVHRVLPRSHTPHHLYEYTVAESVFIEHQADITAEFVRNEVEGVYELGVPPMFRVMVRLGCLCSVDREHRSANKAVDTTFDLADLKLRTVSQDNYLKEAGLRSVLIYHHKSGSNQIVSLFLPAQNRAHLCLVEPRKAASYSHYNKDISKEYSRKRGALPEQMSFEITGESGEQNGFKAINKLLLAYKTDSRAPTVVLVMSNVVERLTAHMPALNEFPIVVVPPLDSDNAFNVAFNWQEIALRCAVVSFVGHEGVLAQQLERARYLHVPVGNLALFSEVGWSSCDLFFARYLAKSEHVLWCTSGAEPDLGGKETVDRRQMLLDGDVPAIQHNKPGSYPTVCVQLDLTYVIINTIVATDKIQEIDGTNSRLFDTTTLPSKTIDEMFPSQDPRKRNLNLASSVSSYDDTVAAAPAFRILRTVFLDWITDVKKYKNPIADELIVGFYKWLRTPSSLLYDPALYKTLQKLMRKVFFKLIEQLSNLGLEVVYANLNKMVVCTKKTDLMEALLHVEYATKATRVHDLFAVIDFQYVAAWDYLLWRDPANYSGIKSDLQSLVTDVHADELSFVDFSGSSQVFSSELRDPARLDIEWHYQRYLSPDPAIQVRFIELLSEFMFSMCGILKDEYSLAQLERTTSLQSQSQTGPTIFTGNDSSVYPSSIEKIESYLLNEVPNKLYTFIMNVRDSTKYLKKTLLNEDVTLPPLLPLKCSFSQNPLVDLINTLCHILVLDKSASKYVGDWKQNMLRILCIDEYSKGARWRSPYSRDHAVIREVPCRGELLINLAELICNHCSMVRDLDLCRDRHCRRLNETWCFVCPGCEKPYDKDSMETALIEQLSTLTELALLQDLQCTKCQQGVIETALAATINCKKCGNGLSCSRSADLLSQQVAVYAALGAHYSMECLESLARWMLEGHQ